MMPLFETVHDVDRQQHILLRRAYGRIEVSDEGQVVEVFLKPWPKISSVVEAKWISPWRNRRRPDDICRAYYNQPIGHRSFLALTFGETTPRTTLKSVYKTMQVLDRIAYIKASDAIVTELTNDKISDRAMRRWGWERHLEDSPKRHWIKRFYGEYPEHAKGTEFNQRLVEEFVAKKELQTM